MRIMTVMGVILAGGAIGAAAVLAPLSMNTQQSPGASTGWMAGLSEQAGSMVRSVATTLTSSTSSQSPAGSVSKAEADRGVVPAVAGAGDGSSVGSLDSSRPSTAATGTAVSAEIVPKRVAVALENGGGRKLTSSKPSGDEARIELVRDIQRELKRVGCYEGDVDGSWGSGSKRAIATFTERVNASLSIDEPDFILLTLLQGHNGQACGATCPAGQTAASGSAGRCVPNGVLAQTNKPAKDRERFNQQRDLQLAQRGAQQQPSADTSSETKVNQLAAAAAGTVAVGSAWTAKVIPEPRAPAQMVEGAKPAVASLDGVGTASVALPSVTPLPGRMAIGAPVPTPANAATAPATVPPPILPSAPVAGSKPSTPKRVAAIDRAAETPDDSDDGKPAQAQSNEAPKAKAAAAPKQPKPQPANGETARNKTVLRSLDQPEPTAKIVRRPQQVVVVQRPPPVRYQAPSYVRGPSFADNSKSARQRRMIYDLFQRPDRN
jgi:hypothetical protein